MPGLRELQNIARVEFNVPLNPGTKFRSYAEEWEVVKDKRTRYSKEVREKSKAKYIGMYLLDEDDEEHPKRVIKRMVCNVAQGPARHCGGVDRRHGRCRFP